MLRARNDPATVLGDREVWSEEPGSQEPRPEEEGLDDVFDALRTSRSEVGEDEDQFDEGTPLEEEGIALRSSSSLGCKTISFRGSVVLTVNNISGAGMLTLPQVFQQSGWVLPILTFGLICVASSLAATFLTDSIARIPGNSRFDRRIEFACVFEEFFGKRMKRTAQIMLIICLFSQILSGIIATSQVVDSLVVFVNPTRSTYALQVLPEFKILKWTAPDQPQAELSNFAGSGSTPPPVIPVCTGSDAVPFQQGDSGLVITLGYLLLFIFLTPFSYRTLDESIGSQKFAFVLLIAFTITFITQFLSEGLVLRRVPAFGDSYRFIVMVPSWLNEKRRDVSVNKTIWTSTALSTVLYIIVGLLGGLAYDQIQGNFLNSLASHCNPAWVRLSSFMFAIICVGLSVPIYCIMTRYSLLVGEICGEGWAFFWTVFFPWLFAWMFYNGGAFNNIVSWSGLLNNGPINFVLPLLVSLKAFDFSMQEIASRTPSSRKDDTSVDTNSESFSWRSPSHYLESRTIVKPLPKCMQVPPYLAVLNLPSSSHL
ncbi:hypothetical protein GUITHDRAFT_103016 [Guillardia theta CCMP2712]|uniref:Amino acid transporter transmembrane domain-containing protein n=1 Tax=Guillardia theta (strain CCMP2712) TaxID=905079 RepID=L1JRL6_GUITC|nr:hypothetical protein GUITHDRAFT_103016 [Guillardia theta CCMP2712]EKX51097.1 hypothetical protein GUITHDRAFT_103016 [Guillardia theta CCMP2712]|eukprot:XP_005838077.1 hypothetical protein GUITHDRAFT_103016 [Guillardia theta CCMP2712]